MGESAKVWAREISLNGSVSSISYDYKKIAGHDPYPLALLLTSLCREMNQYVFFQSHSEIAGLTVRLYLLSD